MTRSFPALFQEIWIFFLVGVLLLLLVFVVVDISGGFFGCLLKQNVYSLGVFFLLKEHQANSDTNKSNLYGDSPWLHTGKH